MPSLNLSGDDHKRLRDALAGAFTLPDLRQLVRLALDDNLDQHIDTNQGTRQ